MGSKREIDRRVFGTDGVRGEVNTFMSAELAQSLGRASAAIATDSDRPGRVLVARDTRESGPMLEAAMVAGITSMGSDALIAGVLPTPAASLLVKKYDLDLAAIISASHNPYRDNGVKFFNSEGEKLDSEQEAEIESLLDRMPSAGQACGSIVRLEGAQDDYLRLLRESFELDLAGTRVLLDCANGATCRVAPEIFKSLGAEVEAFATRPDGRNINDGVGTTHPEVLAERVVGGGHDIGFAFDGDGDRVIAASRNGEVFDGDEMIALAALYLRSRDELTGNGVAVSVMTNLGFLRTMEREGIEVVTTKVGDRHITEELSRRGWVLGGEQSGHVINRKFCPSGDGIGTALLMMEALSGLERDLGVDPLVEKMPQCLVNVSVSDRDGLDTNARLKSEIDAEMDKMGDNGRVLVRASGTEPVIRIMVEAPSEDEGRAVKGFRRQYEKS